jgi:hypothetical protein
MTARNVYLLMFATPVMAALVGCYGSRDTDRDTSGNERSRIVAETRDYSELKSLTLQEAKQRLGDPKEEAEFELTNAVGEFRIELLNHFSEDELAQKPRPLIKEVTWHVEGEKDITLWYRKSGNQWEYVHQLEYHPTDEF